MSTLINCGACNKEISKEALACPHCGHPNKPVVSTPTKEKKSVGCCGSIFGVLFFIWIIGMFAKNSDKNNQQSVTPPPKSEQQIKQEAKFGPKPTASTWDGSYYEVKRYLEKVANDPDSIKIQGCTPVSVDEKSGWVVGCDYRGKNAFGGVIKNSHWFVIKNGQVVKMLPADSYK